ncbi:MULTISPECIES: hypothetical protein [Aestuariivivens]|uniref:hypothetical protein n=1 Tax=Aestuariivivens TaxID=1820275 RepID=UPI001CBAAB71|nr:MULTISPECIES: hypothetical protein [Aestuariivivens]
MKKNLLHTIKSTGFKTPVGYFETFDDKVLSSIKPNRKLKFAETSGFNVPKNYFKNLEDKLIDKVSTNDKTKVIALFSKKQLLYASSIAAAMIVFLNVFVFNSQPSFNTLETQTVENFLIDENISSYELAILLTEEELTEDTFVDYNLEKENLEEYLLNNVDIETILIE